MNQNEKNHFKSFHEGEAASHAKLAECFSKLASSHNAAASDMDAENPSGAQHHRDMAECYKNACAQHVADGQRHLDCYKAVDAMATNEGGANGSSELKTILDTLSKMAVPSGVSVIPRNNTPTLIPRPGAPAQDSEREVARAAMPEELRDIVDPRQARG